VDLLEDRWGLWFIKKTFTGKIILAACYSGVDKEQQPNTNLAAEVTALLKAKGYCCEVHGMKGEVTYGPGMKVTTDPKALADAWADAKERMESEMPVLEKQLLVIKSEIERVESSRKKLDPKKDAGKINELNERLLLLQQAKVPIHQRMQELEIDYPSLQHQFSTPYPQLGATAIYKTQ
jgi:hypothetical protein